ncbi:MAG TPA: signal peptidase I [Firmicutes bacterium]|jgi:signal peptidase I|nr:signal peptidase I [Bacillota bacterium]
MLEIKKTEYRENVESFAIAVVTILFIIIFVIQSFLVSGTSMVPTLLDRERLIVNKFIYWFDTPQRGDIIVLKPPHDTRKYIKRVIGLPGESIEIRSTKVFIDGSEIKEPYINELTNQDFPLTFIPEGSIFVMGDNRNYSKDSRDPDVGMIPLKSVVGRAILVFWPLTKAKILFEPHYNQ